MQNMTVELHDSSSGGGRSKASDSHEYNIQTFLAVPGTFLSLVDE
jgi:hypothetical protein